MRIEMKHWGPTDWLMSLAAAVLCVSSVSLPGATSTNPPTPAERPVITGLRRQGTNVAVTVHVPAGLRRITLEARPQIGRGAWEPRQVVRLDGTAREITFRLPQSPAMQLIRVRASDQDPLPAFFYGGSNVFASATGEGNLGALGTYMPYTTMDINAIRGPDSPEPREVVESDIWRLAGDTLYFFNQNRGLQVIDVRTPDAAVLRGALELPGAGEQMYVLGSGHVVLLAHDPCAGVSQVLVVEVADGPLRIVSALAVPGLIRESRLVGHALYVASQVSRSIPTTDGATWESGTLVSAFDLAAPAQPVARNTLWFGCCEEAVAATDQFFFVAIPHPTNWWQSVVNVIDISDPSGVMALGPVVRPAGRVKDKFKLNLDGSILSIVSEENRWVDSQAILVTRLETFNLSRTSATRLGRLELKRNEQVFASRFAGQRAYIVTFQRIDPLWVVDLSDPLHPRVAGEVEVPGWSTYIHPLGNQLITVGFDNTNGSTRVAVQLFDVSNPAQPTLLDKVPLGSGYTWSEATADEKAFNVLPEAGLILIPYSGYTTNGQDQRVQLIDLGPRSLTLRGVIDHQLPPRRATLHRDRILSLSGWELLSVDATDRDHPEVRGRLELAWPVDRLFLVGDYLLELTTGELGWSGWRWGSPALAPRVRVTPSDAPDRVLHEWELDLALPIAGATVRDGKLYVAQATNEGWWYGPIRPLPAVIPSSEPGSTNLIEDPGKTVLPPPVTNLCLTVIDLAGLPALNVLAQTGAAVEPFGYNTKLEALWPREGLLVWSGGSSGWPWFWLWDGPVTVMPTVGGPVRLGGPMWWWPYPVGSGGRLVAFHVGEPAVPRFASEVNLRMDGVWNFSEAFAANGLVFLSHDVIEYYTEPLPPNPDPTLPEPVPELRYYWVQRSFLDVVDYADPLLPTVRKPVNIPGRLEGLSHQGALLYTVGQHASTSPVNDYRQWLDVSAYDEVSASLVASLELPNEWPSPRLILGGNIFLGRPDSANTAHRLEGWALDEQTGKLTLLGSLTLPTPVESLGGVGGLLAAQSRSNLEIYNALTLARLGGATTPICYYMGLSHAEGALDRGLWVPLGSYGVKRLPVAP